MNDLRVAGANLAYDTRPAAPGSRPAPGAGGAARQGPFIFQHGMGGNTTQPLGYLGDQPPVPVVCLSARGHAPSDDLTDQALATFDRFADDVIALADHLALDRFVIGGISLGAGTAVNLATRYPDRITRLVLCRPAWLDRPQAESNQAAYREIADLLDTCSNDGDISRAAVTYQQSDTYQQVRAASPAAAASLLGQITRPRAVENTLLLRALPSASPTSTSALWAQIQVPTLVIAHHDDPFHPYDVATAYAAAIPNAQFTTVPSKDEDPTGFTNEIRDALHAFLYETTTI